MFKINKKSVFVVDIGSLKLSMLYGTCQNGKAVVLGQSEVSYEGYMDGEFLDEDSLKSHIQNLVSAIEVNCGVSVKALTVSVPAEFSYSLTKKVNVTFASQTKITEEILDEIYASAVENIDGYYPLSTQPIVTTLGDGKKVISALNHKTLRLTAQVNVIYAKQTFIKLLNQVFASIGISSVKYVSAPLVTNQICFKNTAQSVCVLDVGYLSTTLTVFKGKGLEHVFCFSMGGGQIEVDLMDNFALTLKEARELKRNIVLSLNTLNAEFYETSNLGKTRKILTHSANEVVKNRLEELAFVVNECLKKVEAPEYLTIYLTGGGISQIQGAKQYLENSLNRNVQLLTSDFLGFNKPFQTSLISLFLSQISSQ